MSDEKLYRVEFRVVVYAFGEDEYDAEENARGELRENPEMVDAESIDDDFTSTRVVADGWADSYPWGGDGNRTVAQILRGEGA